MAKAYRWFGMTATEEKIQGEAHSEEDAMVRAQAAGCVPGNFRVEENPEYTINDALHESAPEVTGQAASDHLRDLDDKRVLAEANATMFHQLDALKNKCIDLQTVIVAWNSDQHVTAQKDGGEYVEPNFMGLVRSLI